MKGTFGKNVDYQLWRFSDISWIISETCWNFLLKLAWWYIVVLLRDHRNGYFNEWIILSRRFYQSHTLSIQHRQHFQRLLLWHLNIQIFYFLVSVSGVFHYIGFSIFNFFYWALKVIWCFKYVPLGVLRDGLHIFWYLKWTPLLILLSVSKIHQFTPTCTQKTQKTLLPCTILGICKWFIHMVHWLDFWKKSFCFFLLTSVLDAVDLQFMAVKILYPCMSQDPCSFLLLTAKTLVWKILKVNIIFHAKVLAYNGETWSFYRSLIYSQ